MYNKIIGSMNVKIYNEMPRTIFLDTPLDDPGAPRTKRHNLQRLFALLPELNEALAAGHQSPVKIPQGFTITSQGVAEILKHPGSATASPLDLSQEIAELERKTGKKFGDPKNPLIVSVRSSPDVSMPGIMNTILYIGLSEKTKPGIQSLVANPFIAEAFSELKYAQNMIHFGTEALGMSPDRFNQVLMDFWKDKLESDFLLRLALSSKALSKEALNKLSITDICNYLSMSRNKDLLNMIKEIPAALQTVYAENGQHFPQNEWEQLNMAIHAVIHSGDPETIARWRQLRQAKPNGGPEVVIQEMIFSDSPGGNSQTGVAYTGDPFLGTDGPMSISIQGNGFTLMTPSPDVLPSNVRHAQQDKYQPFLYSEQILLRFLSEHFPDIQELEFSVQGSDYYLLQIRRALVTPEAGVQELLRRHPAGEQLTEPEIEQIKAFLELRKIYPYYTLADNETAATAGLTALPSLKLTAISPGGSYGILVSDPQQAKALMNDNQPVIFLATKKDDQIVRFFLEASNFPLLKGIVFSYGARVSHDPTLVRSLGVPAMIVEPDSQHDFTALLNKNIVISPVDEPGSPTVFLSQNISTNPAVYGLVAENTILAALQDAVYQDIIPAMPSFDENDAPSLISTHQDFSSMAAGIIVPLRGSIGPIQFPPTSKIPYDQYSSDTNIVKLRLQWQHSQQYREQNMVMHQLISDAAESLHMPKYLFNTDIREIIATDLPGGAGHTGEVSFALSVTVPSGYQAEFGAYVEGLRH